MALGAAKFLGILIFLLFPCSPIFGSASGSFVVEERVGLLGEDFSVVRFV